MITPSCHSVLSSSTYETEYASINKAGILPRVLAILKESSLILLRAAVKVTAPEGTNGKYS